MADAQLAARLGDKVAHASRDGWAGFKGFVKGFLMGALIAGIGVAAVAFTIGTGGLGGVAIACMVGAVATGGISMGLKKALSDTAKPPPPKPGASGPTCSTITVGSPNVMIENQPAARAGEDKVSHNSQLVAQGSKTVIVNGKPLARINDKAGCGGVIILTCMHTTIGGPAVQVASIAEGDDTLWGIPTKWLSIASTVSGFASAAFMAPFIGVPAVIGGLIGGWAGGKGGSALGGWIGGAIGGERGHYWGSVVGGFAGSFVGGLVGGKVGSGVGKSMPDGGWYQPKFVPKAAGGEPAAGEGEAPAAGEGEAPAGGKAAGAEGETPAAAGEGETPAAAGAGEAAAAPKPNPLQRMNKWWEKKIEEPLSNAGELAGSYAQRGSGLGKMLLGGRLPGETMKDFLGRLVRNTTMVCRACTKTGIEGGAGGEAAATEEEEALEAESMFISVVRSPAVEGGNKFREALDGPGEEKEAQEKKKEEAERKAQGKEAKEQKEEIEKWSKEQSEKVDGGGEGGGGTGEGAGAGGEGHERTGS